jgi:pyruvate dehydrogenase E1 component beta subunit
MKVIIPSTPADAKGLLSSAIFDDDPCLFVETVRLQGVRGEVPVDPGFRIRLGEADVKRAGADVTLIAYGRAVHECLGAAEALQGEGIDAEVLDLRTLLPLDVPAILDSVARTRRAVVVHDAVQFAGPGAEVAATIQHELFDTMSAPVERVGARFVPNPAAPNLEAQVYPSAAKVADAARRAMGVKVG